MKLWTLKKSHMDRCLVMIKLDVNRMQSGSSANRPKSIKNKDIFTLNPHQRGHTLSDIFIMAKLWVLLLNLRVCELKRQGNDTVLSAWLQASWKDLVGSGSAQVSFQCAVITAEESSHTPIHTHTQMLGGARDEWAYWGLVLIKRPAVGSWCKEILWWDYQSTLDSLDSGTHTCRENTLS